MEKNTDCCQCWRGHEPRNTDSFWKLRNRYYLECPKGTEFCCPLEFISVRPGIRLLISRTIRKQMCVVNKI